MVKRAALWAAKNNVGAVLTIMAFHPILEAVNVPLSKE
jgi:hypothetical protein